MVFKVSIHQETCGKTRKYNGKIDDEDEDEGEADADADADDDDDYDDGDDDDDVDDDGDDDGSFGLFWMILGGQISQNSLGASWVDHDYNGMMILVQSRFFSLYVLCQNCHVLVFMFLVCQIACIKIWVSVNIASTFS